MSLFSAIKRNSKNALRDNWSSAIFVLLIPTVSIFILTFFFSIANSVLITEIFPNTGGEVVLEGFSEIWAYIAPLLVQALPIIIVSFFFLIMIVVVIVPLNLGVTNWYYQLVKGNPQPVSSIFKGFEKAKWFGRSIWLNINIGFRSLFWSILFFSVPSVLLTLATLGLQRYTQGATHMIMLFFLGFVMSGGLVIFIALLYMAYVSKYMLTPYFVLDDDQIKVNQAAKKSIEYTMGFRFNSVWFRFSFIGWFFLCLFPPVLLYVLPYYNTAFALYCYYIIETKERQQPVMQESPTAPQDDSYADVNNGENLAEKTGEFSIVPSVIEAPPYIPQENSDQPEEETTE